EVPIGRVWPQTVDLEILIAVVTDGELLLAGCEHCSSPLRFVSYIRPIRPGAVRSGLWRCWSMPLRRTRLPRPRPARATERICASPTGRARRDAAGFAASRYRLCQGRFRSL